MDTFLKHCSRMARDRFIAERQATVVRKRLSQRTWWQSRVALANALRATRSTFALRARWIGRRGGTTQALAEGAKHRMNECPVLSVRF
jgi:hypothetical protein